MARRERCARLPLGAIAGLAALTLGAGECSYRGHVFGSVGPAATAVEQAQGPISAFGSVTVGGVEYATLGAAVSQDGSAGVESQLLVGQLATISGSLAAGGSTGTADTLVVTDPLVGIVTAVAPGSLTVLGATVRVNGDTSVGAGIVPADALGLAPGDLVVVSGLRTRSGWLATRLDRVAPGRALRVSGRVAGLKNFGQSFTLGAATVDFSSATTVPPGLANGQYVIATGPALIDPTTLRATLIESASEAPAGANGDGGSLYGAVTRFVTADDFDVAGVTVTSSASTSWVDGGASGLALDAVLEVSGQYDGAGRLAASRIAFRAEPTVRVVGPADALDPSASTVTIAGITLATDARTRWDDHGAVPLRAFGFGALGSGDWLEVRGIATGARTARAGVVERHLKPVPAPIELQDVAAAVADPQFTLTGVGVDARAAFFQDSLGRSLSRAAFFGQAAGRLVRARGQLLGGTLSAELVALRD